MTSRSDIVEEPEAADRSGARRVEAVIASEEQLPAAYAVIAALRPLIGDAAESVSAR